MVSQGYQLRCQEDLIMSGLPNHIYPFLLALLSITKVQVLSLLGGERW